MTSLPRRRRSAETFDAWVEDGASDDAAGAFSGLTPTVTALREHEPVDPSPDFVDDLRGRLMLAARTELVADPRSDVAPAARTATPARRRRRVAAVVGGLTIVGATASMGVAAQTALPGDTLYPLKRAIEDAQVGLEGGDGIDRGEKLLANATGRLDELGALERAGSQDAEAMSTTLRDFVDQATEASTLMVDSYRADGQTATIKQLRVFTITSLDTISRLEPSLPDPVRGALEDATDALNRIDQLALSICPSCTDLPALTLGADTEPASTESERPSPSTAPSTRPKSPGPSGGRDGTGGPSDDARPERDGRGKSGATETPSAPDRGGLDDDDAPSAPQLGSGEDDAGSGTRGGGLGGLVGGALGQGNGSNNSNGGGNGRGGDGGRGTVSDNGVGDLVPGLGDLANGVGDGLTGR